ncbi:MAG: pyrroline-5-carboxylate reductase [Desulfoplanes sp.]
MKLGIIGTGNMGTAIALGVKTFPELALFGYNPSEDKLEALAERSGLIPCASSLDVCEQSEYIVLAVKPNVIKSVLEEIKPALGPKKCLISIAAGVTLESLRSFSGDICPVVRIMPNTPALVGAGVFGVCFDHALVLDEHKAFILNLFGCMGKTHVLKETLFDAFTGLVGSGPAYVFYLMEGFIDAGVALGLTRAQSTDMVKGLFTGSAKMAEKSDLHITQLKEMVTSPGGTTVAGLNVFEEKAVKHALYKGVKASMDRSKELG